MNDINDTIDTMKIQLKLYIDSENHLLNKVLNRYCTKEEVLNIKYWNQEIKKLKKELKEINELKN
jgi:hypothetical protein